MHNVPSLQVLGYVMITSLTCKTDLDDDFDDAFEDEEAYVLQQDEAWYSDEKIIKTKVYRYVNFVVKFLFLNLNFPSPYGKDFLLALKKARIKQVRSQAVANELFTYSIFLIVLFVISYANRDQDSFNIKNHIGEKELKRLIP